MSSKKLLGITVFAAAVAVAGLGATLPAASSRAPAAGKAEYLPIQNIHYDLGSKAVSGYFVTQHDACAVTLMVAEKRDPDAPLVLSAARVRLVLQPGQLAGLDSEEGRSLNVTCGEGGTTLHVETGERSKLMALQQLALRRTSAELR